MTRSVLQPIPFSARIWLWPMAFDRVRHEKG